MWEDNIMLHIEYKSTLFVIQFEYLTIWLYCNFQLIKAWIVRIVNQNLFE